CQDLPPSTEVHSRSPSTCARGVPAIRPTVRIAVRPSGWLRRFSGRSYRTSSSGTRTWADPAGAADRNVQVVSVFVEIVRMDLAAYVSRYVPSRAGTLKTPAWTVLISWPPRNRCMTGRDAMGPKQSNPSGRSCMATRFTVRYARVLAEGSGAHALTDSFVPEYGPGANGCL